MSFATANGAHVLSGTVALSRRGAWHACLTVDAADLSAFAGGAGPVTIVLGALTLKGTIYRASDFGARVGLIVQGGAGLRSVLEPRHYRGVPTSLVASAVLSDVGEVLSSTSTATTLATVLDGWTRLRGTASAALWRIADELGATWRVLADGSTWIGVENWPASALALRSLSEDSVEGRAIVDGDGVELLAPGVTVGGRRVSQVRHHIEEDRIRTEVFYEGAAGDDRVRQDLASIIDRKVDDRADFLALYPARVVSQASNGRVDVQPDSDKLPTFSGLPIRGLVGQTIKVSPGARVLVGFEAGDPGQPYASPAWETGATLASPLAELATQTGVYPALQHVTSIESVAVVLLQLMIQIGAQITGPITGAQLAAQAMAILPLAIAAAGASPIDPTSLAAITAALAAKAPDSTGLIPGVGCPHNLVG